MVIKVIIWIKVAMIMSVILLTLTKRNRYSFKPKYKEC